MTVTGLMGCYFSFEKVTATIATKRLGEMTISLDYTQHEALRELSKDIEDRLLKIIEDIENKE